MDPTFGGQELLESLSQASSTGKSRQSKDSRSKSSRGSSNSTLTSTHTNPVEDAYRRIGQGLSQRAQGDDRHHMKQLQQRARLGTHPCTSFDKYQRLPKKPFNPHDLVGQHPHPTQGGPSSKIPKLGGRFQDPGGSSVGGDSASAKPSQKVLKKITLQAKETFHKWRRQQKAGYLNKYAPSSGSLPGTLSTSASSNNSFDQYGRLTEQQLLLQHQQQSMSLAQDDTSPQRHALSQMALQQQQQQQQQHLNGSTGGQPTTEEDQPKGLLSAVLEGGSDSAYESESVHSLPTINSQKTGVSRNSLRGSGAGANAYHQYPGPGSLGSSNSLPMNQQHHPPNAAAQQPALHFATPRGRCLTQPAEPVGNEGLDNVEGNMILFQSDILVVPGRATKVGGLSNNGSKGLEFHVQSLLGQGTFAQVFCCWESVSKKHVALKIIKNKPAFTKQAAVEIEVFQALAAKSTDGSIKDPAADVGGSTPASPHMVHLLSSFMYKSHLCLVFECLGMNLYEVLKRRQFRGLPLPMVRTLVKQALEGVKELAGKTIVHCDLKPENILLVGEEAEKDVLGAGELSKGAELKRKDASSSNSVSSVSSNSPQTIKLIDFGSACFEGYSAHTYIQSRFYRSPEVLMGLPYDSAIDIWSLGCVAAELFLGLPILPGVHEHDQCGRIIEMIGEIPDWMLEQGTKSNKYFVKFVAPRNAGTPGTASTSSGSGGSNSTDQAKVGQSSASDRPMLPQWRLKTQDEYIKSLTQNEIRKKGGLAKLEKQPANRYFKRTKLSDIIMLHGQHCVGDDKELLGMFVHFLYGVLDPDPWKRWTAYQASQHPFITNTSGQLRKKTPQTKLDYKEENQANCNFDMYWQPPWDPGICRRKLLNVQRMREKQNAQRRGYVQPRQTHGLEQQSPSLNSVNSIGQPMIVADSPSVGHMSVDGKNSPPSQIAGQAALQQAKARAAKGMSAGSMPKGGIASSMSAIGTSGMSSALGTENPNRNEHLMNTPSNKGQQMFTGPQSYTGLGNFDDPPNEADFAYALQRPGNVPALSSSVTSSHAGGASVSSAKQHRIHQQHYHQQPQHPQHPQHFGRMPQGSLQASLQGSMQGSVPKYPGGSHVSSVNSLPNSAGYPNQVAGMMGVGGVSYQGHASSVGGIGGSLSSSGRFDDQPGGVQYLAQQRQLQKQQSRLKNQQPQQQHPSMDQIPPHLMTEYHHQMLIEQQQKQLAALQQQHQQQLAALQQQQQLAFQQQQQQFLNQQYGTTGNGYYYVTSADGTPMMVQGGSAPMGTSYDGAASGSYRGIPAHQQQRMPGYDTGGGSVRDSRSNQRPSRSGRRGNDNYRGPGMSM